MTDWDELAELSERYADLKEREEQLYLDLAGDLQDHVEDGEMTERAAKAVLQVVIVADDEDDWNLAQSIFDRALMFPHWEPESLLVEDEELEGDDE